MSAHATRRGRCGLTEGLRNVNVTNRKLRGALLVPRDHRPPETVRQTLIQQFDSTKGHSICSLLVPARIAPSNTRPACHHSIGAPLGKLPVSANFTFFTPMCSSLSSGRTCSTVGDFCDGADDDDDPPCATGADTV